MVTKKKAKSPKSAARAAKKAAKKTATATTAAAGGRNWNQSYKYLKSPGDTGAETSNRYAVFTAIKELRSGTADEIAKAAVKAGLETTQDARSQTMIFLRQFAAEGSVEVVRSTKAKAEATPAVEKAPKATTAKPRVRLRVAKKKTKADQAEAPATT
jgi:hypothetical protein